MTPEKERSLELEQMKLVMSTEAGRAVIYRMIERAGVYRTSYSIDGNEQHMAFCEGQRNMGLWLITELEEACAGSFLKMIQENRNAT